MAGRNAGFWTVPERATVFAGTGRVRAAAGPVRIVAGWVRAVVTQVPVSARPAFAAVLPVLAAVSPARGAVSVTPAQGAVSVTLSMPYAQVQPSQSVAFSAAVTGSANTKVVWQVNNAVGGSASAGTVTAGGVFTAPAALPSPASVTVTAVSAADPSASATATITLVAQAAAGTTYYVAKTGADGNPGTLASPFLTIQHAAGVAAAGDTVLVEAGVYNELVAPRNSGNATQGYITFSAAPGQAVAIDGTGLAIPGGQWGLVTLQNSSFVVVQGFELRNYTTSSVRDVPVGVYVSGAGSNVQIVNNHIHDITTTAKTTPKACGSDALGMAVYGSAAPAAISGLVVSGNEIDDLMTGCSESLSIDGNVDGFAVTSNVVHDNDNIGIDAIGFERVSPDPAYDQARHGEIRGNIVYNITSYGNPDYGRQYAADGIYVDGGTQIIIEQNLVHNADLGIELASEHKGHVTSAVIARNNVVYQDNSNGISIGGYGPNRGGSDGVTVVNNTLWDNDTKHTGSGEFQIQFNATNNLFENNIVYASAQALMVHDYAPAAAAPATLDANLYFSPKGAAKSVFQWEKTRYSGFAKYLAGSGQDGRSVFADPLFVDPGAPPVLDVMAGSPAIGAGLDLGEAVVGSVDFAGNRRIVGHTIDIGAYQR